MASSIFQISGLGSGFNTDTILDKLLEVERRPISLAEARQAEATRQQTAWRTLNTRLRALDQASRKLADPELFRSRTATSSDSEVLTATAQSGQDLGNFSLTVERLAQQHQLISQGYATADAAVGSGTVTLQVGSAQYAPIAVADGTLSGLRDAINAANVGVRASLVDAGEGAGSERYRLVLNSQSTGSIGQVQVQLSLSGGTQPLLGELQAAQDAHVRLGTGASAVDLYSSSNTLTDVLPGVTMSLKSARPGVPVEVRLARDPSPVRSAVEDLVSGYNALSAFFAEQFHYDQATGQTGILFGDSALLSLQNRLFDAVTDPRHVDGAYSSLASIGVKLDDKGNLAIADEATFSAALARPDDLLRLFSTESVGVARTVQSAVLSATDPVTGTVTTQERMLTERYEELGRSIDTIKARVSRSEERYRRRFLEMERAMSQLRSQSQALTAQLSTLPQSSSASSTGGT
ncbi:MAG: flagellar filament capping protein FliD [Candidatus Eremiobacterota bacterium]